MKKFFALLIIVVFMLSLSACGSKPQPTPTAAPTAAPTEEPAEPTAEPTTAPAEPTSEPEEKSETAADYDPNDMGSVFDYYDNRGELCFFSVGHNREKSVDRAFCRY